MKDYNYTKEQLNKYSHWVKTEKNINEIKVGDTILCRDGIIRTVCNNNIGGNSFMGVSIFGDSWNGGSVKVKSLSIQTRICNS